MIWNIANLKSKLLSQFSISTSLCEICSLFTSHNRKAFNYIENETGNRIEEAYKIESFRRLIYSIEHEFEGEYFAIFH